MEGGIQHAIRSVGIRGRQRIYNFTRLRIEVKLTLHFLILALFRGNRKTLCGEPHVKHSSLTAQPFSHSRRYAARQQRPPESLPSCGRSVISWPCWKNSMKSPRRYGVAIFLVAVVFGLANFDDLTCTIPCSDCSLAYGLPFTFYNGGGGGSGPVWSGIFDDLLIVLVPGAVIGWLWNRSASKKPN